MYAEDPIEQFVTECRCGHHQCSHFRRFVAIPETTRTMSFRGACLCANCECRAYDPEGALE